MRNISRKMSSIKLPIHPKSAAAKVAGNVVVRDVAKAADRVADSAGNKEEVGSKEEVGRIEDREEVDAERASETD